MENKVKKFFRILRRLAICFSLLFLSAALLSFLYDIPLPSSLVLHPIEDACGPDFAVEVGGVSFRSGEGVRIKGISVSGRDDNKGMFVRTGDIVVKASLIGLLANPLRAVDSVKIQSIRMPSSIPFTGSTEPLPPFKPKLPAMKPFKVFLEDVDILGVKAKTVEIGRMEISPKGVNANGVTIVWPDTDVRMAVFGSATLDLVKQEIVSKISGTARQPNVRPFLKGIDIFQAFPYFDNFTGVENPVLADFTMQMPLDGSGFHMSLGMRSKGGKYNGVELGDYSGVLEIDSTGCLSNRNCEVRLRDVSGRDKSGGPLDGTLKITSSDTGLPNHIILDIKTASSLSNMLEFAEILNDGTLDFIQPETPPEITAKGRLAYFIEDAEQHSVKASVAFDRGRIFNMPLRNVEAELSLDGTVLSANPILAYTPNGGRIDATNILTFADYDASRAAFSTYLKVKEVPLSDVADFFGFEVGDRHGEISGEIDLSGPANTNALRKLCGKGRFVCKDGHLSTIPVFGGITDYLSKRVPGISQLVDQSQGSLDFTISNGVFKTSNLVIEGSVFSIRGSGTYDLPGDNLVLDVDVRLFKNDSILGTLTMPITWTFSKLFMEFRVSGPLQSPKTKYKTPLDKIGGGS